jgi:LmbE family N-acetylglucosaminyl deacetylase
MVFAKKVVLAVGAHPDDIELGSGGTIYKAVQDEARVIALYMTRGGKITDTNVRMKESTEAMNVLGVKEIYFENFPDTEIPESFEAINCLEQYASKYQPDIVLTHSINDTHQDHRRVAWLAMSSFRNVPKVLAFETPRVRRCHVSQNEKRYLAYESTVNLASFRGSQVGIAAAEAFEIVKYVEG